MSLEERARQHAALGNATRLAIVEELLASDRSPGELGELLAIPGNLLAHHVEVLESAGLVDRVRSEGDARRRYLRVDRIAVGRLGVAGPEVPEGVVFVCTHNSARSQLAAALWNQRTGHDAISAGTHPASRVDPRAAAAARHAGLPFDSTAPRRLEPDDLPGRRVIAVCDRAHEELDAAIDRWHWSIPDPAIAGTDTSFHKALTELADRITTLTMESG